MRLEERADAEDVELIDLRTRGCVLKRAVDAAPPSVSCPRRRWRHPAPCGEDAYATVSELLCELTFMGPSELVKTTACGLPMLTHVTCHRLPATSRSCGNRTDAYRFRVRQQG